MNNIIPIIFPINFAPLNGLKIKIIPQKSVISESIKVEIHELFCFCLNSVLYYNFTALLKVMINPKINGMILANAFGLLITIIPNIAIPIP